MIISSRFTLLSSQSVRNGGMNAAFLGRKTRGVVVLKGGVACVRLGMGEQMGRGGGGVSHLRRVG